ncbi:MAG: hypothetical protein AAF195_02310 [Pseudomonadota bacterium]
MQYGQLMKGVKFASSYKDGAVITEDTLKDYSLKPDLIMVSGMHAAVTFTASENYYTQQMLKFINGESDINSPFLQDFSKKDDFWPPKLKELKQWKQDHPDANIKDYIFYLPQTDLTVRALAALYRENGHNVNILLSKEGLYDAQYSTDQNKTITALKKDQNDNSFTSQKTYSFFPNFTHESRQGEVQLKKDGMKNLGHEFIDMKEKIEFGDTRFCLYGTEKHPKGFILAGIAENKSLDNGLAMETVGRSTEEAHEELRNTLQEIGLDIDVITIELKQPFYHIDTTGVPTAHGHFFTCKEAYTDESWQKLQDIYDDKLINLPKKDIADAFGGNGICFGNEIYISDIISNETINKMTELGYNVNLMPIPFTMASGGGHRCMTSAHHFYPIGEGNNLSQYRPKLPAGKGQVKQVSINDLSNTKERGRGYSFTLEDLVIKDNKQRQYENARDITEKAMDYNRSYQVIVGKTPAAERKNPKEQTRQSTTYWDWDSFVRNASDAYARFTRYCSN